MSRAGIIIDRMSDSWDYRVFWDETINTIRQRITEQEYTMWFSRMAYVRAERDLICVSVPSSFYRDQVKQRYLNEIQSTFEELSGAHVLIDFEINKTIPTNQTSRVHTFDQSEGSPNEVRNPVAASAFTPADNSVTAFKQPVATAPKQRSDKPPMLNPDYTFDNYVIGDNNNFAANAAMAVVRQPGMAYNPFLVYGGVGLGKTHLIQSIGNFIHDQTPEKKIIYVQMETFTNEFVFALRDGKTQLFKNKYRNADVLLIDDIHFIQGKTETQEELFNTFNALYENKKQLVFTCDRPVSEIKDITDRLKNRFERGLNVDLQLPSYETRLAILKKKSDQWGISIPEESLHIICNNITTNIRDLEKALTKLRAYVELVNKDITPEITKQQLKDFFTSTNKKNITIELIIKEVAIYFNLTPQDLKNKKRNQSVAWPRQVAMYISRQLTEYSTTEIGMEFGGRDHSTVMHGCQKVAEQMKGDPTVEPYVNELIRKIRQEGSRS
jgi:chromosomal replication initiator protein